MIFDKLLYLPNIKFYKQITKQFKLYFKGEKIMQNIQEPTDDVYFLLKSLSDEIKALKENGIEGLTFDWGGDPQRLLDWLQLEIFKDEKNDLFLKDYNNDGYIHKVNFEDLKYTSSDIDEIYDNINILCNMLGTIEEKSNNEIEENVKQNQQKNKDGVKKEESIENKDKERQQQQQQQQQQQEMGRPSLLATLFSAFKGAQESIEHLGKDVISAATENYKNENLQDWELSKNLGFNDNQRRNKVMSEVKTSSIQGDILKNKIEKAHGSVKKILENKDLKRFNEMVVSYPEDKEKIKEGFDTYMQTEGIESEENEFMLKKKKQVEELLQDLDQDIVTKASQDLKGKQGQEDTFDLLEHLNKRMREINDEIEEKDPHGLIFDKEKGMAKLVERILEKIKGFFNLGIFSSPEVDKQPEMSNM